MLRTLCIHLSSMGLSWTEVSSFSVLRIATDGVSLPLPPGVSFLPSQPTLRPLSSLPLLLRFPPIMEFRTQLHFVVWPVYWTNFWFLNLTLIRPLPIHLPMASSFFFLISLSRLTSSADWFPSFSLVPTSSSNSTPQFHRHGPHLNHRKPVPPHRIPTASRISSRDSETCWLVLKTTACCVGSCPMESGRCSTIVVSSLGLWYCISSCLPDPFQWFGAVAARWEMTQVSRIGLSLPSLSSSLFLWAFSSFSCPFSFAALLRPPSSFLPRSARRWYWHKMYQRVPFRLNLNANTWIQEFLSWKVFPCCSQWTCFASFFWLLWRWECYRLLPFRVILSFAAVPIDGLLR